MGLTSPTRASTVYSYDLQSWCQFGQFALDRPVGYEESQPDHVTIKPQYPRPHDPLLHFICEMPRMVAAGTIDGTITKGLKQRRRSAATLWPNATVKVKLSGYSLPKRDQLVLDFFLRDTCLAEGLR